MSFTKFVSVAALAAFAAAQNTTTYTVESTSIETITSCAETVTDCPARNHNGTAYVTHTFTSIVTTCPESGASSTESSVPEESKSAVATSAPATSAPAVTSAPVTEAPASSNSLTTYVTVEQGVTVTVVGTKPAATNGTVEQVPETSSGAVAEANGANAVSFGGAAAAFVAGALLL